MSSDNRVWIVDDDHSIRWVLERALTQAGIANESFADADELLQQIGAGQPDVIISDIRMPGIDGLELLSRIHASHPGLPVIITTAHSDLDSAVESYQRGAFEYLPKPFDLDEVVWFELQKGHYSLHDARIIHGANSNTSSTRRAGYTMRYFSLDMKFNAGNAPGHKLYHARGENIAKNELIYHN